MCVLLAYIATQAAYLNFINGNALMFRNMETSHLQSTS